MRLSILCIVDVEVFTLQSNMLWNTLLVNGVDHLFTG